MSEYGYNYRVSELTALIGVQQIGRASDVIQERKRVAEFYDKHLEGIPGVHPIGLPTNVFSTYYKYIAYLDEEIDRAQIKTTLKRDFGISLPSEVYTDLCHTEPLWQKYTYCGRQRTESRVACHRWPACGCKELQDRFPGAEYISRHHICLPIYPGLSADELKHVVNCLWKVVMQEKES